MKYLFLLSALTVIHSVINAQQFLKDVASKEYYPDKSLTFAGIVGNAGNSILFNAGYGSIQIGSQSSLYLTGGSPNTDYLIKNQFSTSKANYLYAWPNIYFATSSNQNKYIIFKTDLNTGSTGILQQSESHFYYPVKAGNLIFYWGDVNSDGEINKKLYKTDGSTAGTSLVKNLNINRNSLVSKMISHNANVYFLESDSTGCRLWRSNGTSNGTTVVADVHCNFNNCLPQTPVLMNGCIYFVVDYPLNETYLWKYDIAGNSKQMVSKISDENQKLDAATPLTASNRYPVSRYGFNVSGNSLYFRGNLSGQTGLWKSNGTSAGTMLVKPISGELDEFITVNNKLYFIRSLYTYGSKSYYKNITLQNAVTVRQLWVSDGTEAGTTLVKDFPIRVTCDPDPRLLTNCNNQLLLFVYDSTGYEPYRGRWIAGLNSHLNGTKYFFNKNISSFIYNRETGLVFYTDNNETLSQAVLHKSRICNTASLPNNKFSVTQNASEDPVFNKAATCDSLIAIVLPKYRNTGQLKTTASVWIEKKQPVKFVKRHYQISPTIGSDGKSGGKITLYFRQSEFDDFNALYSPALPSAGTSKTDNRGNIRIAWYPDTSSDHSGLPYSYTAKPVMIDPIDDQIIWNTELNCWEISFECSGFGGFIIQTSTTPLAYVDSPNSDQDVACNGKWMNTQTLNYQTRLTLKRQTGIPEKKNITLQPRLNNHATSGL